ncbi:MAG TPA: pirin family protein [Candidatus Baltobacteraceae bacterium]|nr:pirin family protein [Candidatus Baltobacteraceae bacterium]
MNPTLPRTFAVQRSGERYHARHGWLDSYHSFSFADYFDPENLNWGTLRVFNDDRIAAGTGFPLHPHRDMEILTYVFAGELEHQDSMGNRGVVKAGGVQFMSAGTGVRHSETNARDDKELHLVQMWVLPGKNGAPPTYGQMDFTQEDRRNRWLAVASGHHAINAPIALTQNAALLVARLENHELRHTFEPSRFGFLFVGEGEIEANGEHLRAGDAVRMYAIERLDLRGTGEVVLWDLSALDHDAA